MQNKEEPAKTGLEIARIARRSDCECPQNCFKSLQQDVDVVDISMGFTVEIHFGDLAKKHPNVVALNATCNRIAVLTCLADPANPAPFERLVWLDLSHNMLAAVPSDLAKICPFLVHVDFSSNHFTDLVSMQHLATLYKLQHIDLSYNQIFSLAGIQHLTSITHLDLQRNKIESMTPLIGCLGLKRLNIAHNLLHSVAECISSIGKLPDLRRLDVYGNPFCQATGNSDFREAFALKTHLIFLDGVNLRLMNSDLPQNFLHNTDPTSSNLLPLRRLFEDKLRTLHSDLQNDLNRLHRLMEELSLKFDDRCKRLALDYEAAKQNAIHYM